MKPEQIKSLRQALGLPQATFGKLLGYTARTSITLIEHGKKASNLLIAHLKTIKYIKKKGLTDEWIEHMGIDSKKVQHEEYQSNKDKVIAYQKKMKEKQ